MSGYQSKRKAAQAKLTTEEEHMKIVEIKDCAYPCMMAERAVKNVYNLMLEGKKNEAIAECITAIHEIEDIITAIQNAKIKTPTNS